MRGQGNDGLRGVLLALALLVPVAFTGCIASEGEGQRLSVAETSSGDLVVYLVLENGRLDRASAWWAEAAPELDIQVPSAVPGWELLVLKNDVVLTREAVQGTPATAYAFWDSSDSGTVASAGDSFEFLVVNATAEQTVASFALGIEA